MISSPSLHPDLMEEAMNNQGRVSMMLPQVAEAGMDGSEDMCLNKEILRDPGPSMHAQGSKNQGDEFQKDEILQQNIQNNTVTLVKADRVKLKGSSHNLELTEEKVDDYEFDNIDARRKRKLSTEKPMEIAPKRKSLERQLNTIRFNNRPESDFKRQARELKQYLEQWNEPSIRSNMKPRLPRAFSFDDECPVKVIIEYCKVKPSKKVQKLKNGKWYPKVMDKVPVNEVLIPLKFRDKEWCVKIVGVYFCPDYACIIMKNAGPSLKSMRGNDEFQKYVANNRQAVYNDLILPVEILRCHGISHNDIKPDNICVSKVGEKYTFVLIDFESSHSHQDDPSTKMRCTPEFLPPSCVNLRLNGTWTAKQFFDAGVDFWGMTMTFLWLLNTEWNIRCPDLSNGSYSYLKKLSDVDQDRIDTWLDDTLLIVSDLKPLCDYIRADLVVNRSRWQFQKKKLPNDLNSVLNLDDTSQVSQCELECLADSFVKSENSQAILEANAERKKRKIDSDPDLSNLSGLAKQSEYRPDPLASMNLRTPIPQKSLIRQEPNHEALHQTCVQTPSGKTNPHQQSLSASNLTMDDSMHAQLQLSGETPKELPLIRGNQRAMQQPFQYQNQQYQNQQYQNQQTFQSGTIQQPSQSQYQNQQYQNQQYQDQQYQNQQTFQSGTIQQPSQSQYQNQQYQNQQYQDQQYQNQQTFQSGTIQQPSQSQYQNQQYQNQQYQDQQYQNQQTFQSGTIQQPSQSQYQNQQYQNQQYQNQQYQNQQYQNQQYENQQTFQQYQNQQYQNQQYQNQQTFQQYQNQQTCQHRLNIPSDQHFLQQQKSGQPQQPGWCHHHLSGQRDDGLSAPSLVPTASTPRQNGQVGGLAEKDALFQEMRLREPELSQKTSQSNPQDSPNIIYIKI